MNLLLNATPATESLGDILPLGAILPFVVMLLAIAVLPLATPGWYGPLRNKAIVAAAIGVPVLAYVIAVGGSTALERVIATGEEYISFIIYLATLFTISGGIYISGDAAGSPRNNTIVLAIGSVLANFIGTTGAAMLLIRPLLRANHRRTVRKHVFIFLIFIVCNTGGLLTPLGDPPLFLGFLRGIDFTWTLRLWPSGLMTQAILLAVFFLVDSFYFRKEPRRGAEARGGDPRADPRQGHHQHRLPGRRDRDHHDLAERSASTRAARSSGGCATRSTSCCCSGRSTSARRSRGRSTGSCGRPWARWPSSSPASSPR